MPEKDDSVYLLDMLNAGWKIREFVAGKSEADYLQDEVLQAAIERKVEIIGEAARYISDEFKAAHPEVPWRPIMAQRHILAHDYGEILQEKLWRVATLRVPELQEMLEKLLPPEKRK